jgi:hypothetical protein
MGRRHGLTRDQLDTMVRRGDLIRIHRGVYRHAAAPVTDEMMLRASLLAVGPLGVVSHRSALVRHGCAAVECRLVEITHRSASLPMRRGLVVHRSSTLGAEDVRAVRGLPTTSPARTLVDCAAVVAPALVARWAQMWLAQKMLRVDELEQAAHRAGRHIGALRLQHVLHDVVAEADSAAEARLGRILSAAGIPPQLHVAVTVESGVTFELDWAYPTARVGLEMDGYGVHLRSIDAFEHDRHRRNELEIAGWRVLNFTTKSLRHPARLVDQVVRALAVSTSPEPGRRTRRGQSWG